MMRPNRKHNSILNSPFVRALINPVQTIIPTATTSASTSSSNGLDSTSIANADQKRTQVEQHESLQTQAANEDELDGTSIEQHLIPTQPPVEVVETKSLGKKRSRSRSVDPDEPVLEWDEREGKRFGVVTRYDPDQLPKELEKYWAQRYRLFSLFDSGCEMDREGWYSVTPENIAAQIAERCRSGVIVDAFCGVGGNAIQFAFTCERVIAFDTSRVRLACAKRNAQIYGVADRITFIHADWVQWTKEYIEQKKKREIAEDDEIEVIFLSPPWGGISYESVGTTNTTDATPQQNKRRRTEPMTELSNVSPSTPVLSTATPATPSAYPLCALAPLHGAELFSLAAQVTPHIAYFLPRNVDLLEVANLSPLKPGEREGGKRERVEIEEEWMSGKLKAVTAYFGDLVVGSGRSDQDEEDDSNGDSS
ncbi:RNA methyltransferase [Sporobolomyces koalae]|uniref:RNA methyltransferase n=1 Tax=Sporobolomyces koalae TaxID=500713 RepID=UPI0031760DED